jgi:hypothetical protein
VERALGHAQRARDGDGLGAALREEGAEAGANGELEVTLAGRRRSELEAVGQGAEDVPERRVGRAEARAPGGGGDGEGGDGVTEADGGAEELLVARRVGGGGAREANLGGAEGRVGLRGAEAADEDGEGELVADGVARLGGGVDDADLAAVGAGVELEGEAVGDGAEVIGEGMHGGLDGLGARGEVIDVAEGAERDGEADLGRELLARCPAEGFFVEALERGLGDEGVERLELVGPDAGRVANGIGVEAEGAEGGEEGAGGDRGEEPHGARIASAPPVVHRAPTRSLQGARGGGQKALDPSPAKQ